MAQGPLITPDVEALITSVYYEHHTWKAWEIRNEVNRLLSKNNPKLSAKWPGVSSVQKVLAAARKNTVKLGDDPQEKPWSLATLDDSPIPPEAVPAVLAVWKSRTALKEPFTVREAKWAARMSALLADIQGLDMASNIYASAELLAQLTGRPFNSSALERIIMDLPPDYDNPLTYLPSLAHQGGAGKTVEQVLRNLNLEVERMIKANRKGGK